MKFSIIIPARYDSTRLPGKPLADIAGKPMIQWVYERAQQSQAESVIVATDDERIEASVRAFGGDVIMTASTHHSGTDRLQEVVQAHGFTDDHIVVNVQGDEPLIPPSVINQVAENLAQTPKASVATLCEAINDVESLFDPNAVKVVKSAGDIALYFSRAPVPFKKAWTSDFLASDLRSTSLIDITQGMPYFRHIGIYAYRTALLNQFVRWPVSLLEQAESLEQLRVLENDCIIHCAEASESIPSGIDTQADLDKIRAMLERK